MECKYGDAKDFNDLVDELIETLWNVNSFDTVSATGTIRINRNIVECKYICPKSFVMPGISELIETLWNVNNCSNMDNPREEPELIETLWNVNK